MSRVVELVVGIALLAGLGYWARHEYAVLHAWNATVYWVMVGGAAYAAICTAALSRRIADPTLKTPIVAWIVIVVFWIMDLVSAMSSTNENRYGTYEYDEEERRRRRAFDGPEPDDKAGIGLLSAIVSTILAAACYGGLMYAMFYMGKRALEP